VTRGVRVPTLTVLDALSPQATATEAPNAGLIVDVPHPNAAARAKFARPGPFPVAALQWRTEDGEPTERALSFQVAEHVGWLASGSPNEVDAADVVKQVSFLHKSATVTLDEFRTHYRHHVEVARRHMPTLWQYVQYDVLGIHGHDTTAASGIVAVSVLWFRSTGDFLERYFASPQDEADFRSQEGFLDLSKAFTFVAGALPGTSPVARP
jgi:hypothetical protein